MQAYAIAHLRNVTLGPPIAHYLERIDATLTPFGGRFLVHGGDVESLEGGFDSAVVIIAFPDMAAARDWYQSDAYQAILPLRTENAECTAFLVQGAEDGHKAADVMA